MYTLYTRAHPGALLLYRTHHLQTARR